MSERSRNADIEQELRRGLSSAFRALAKMEGISFDPEKFLRTRFINAGDGASLEFGFYVETPARSKMEDGFFDTLSDAVMQVDGEMQKRLEKIRCGTFQCVSGNGESLEPEAPDEAVSFTAIQGKTLDDWVGGINALLAELEAPRGDFVTLGRSR